MRNVALILILIIIVAFVVKSKAGNSKSTGTGGQDESLGDIVNSILDEGPATIKDCRPNCRSLCKNAKQYGWKNRNQCKRACKSDCIKKGLEYSKQNYP